MQSKILYVVGCLALLISVIACLCVASAEQSPSWQTAPDFQNSVAQNMSWKLADDNQTPVEGDLVWAVPVTENSTSEGTPEPIVPVATESPTTTAPTPNPDQTPAFIILAVLIAAIFAVPIIAFSKIRGRKTLPIALTALLVCGVFTAVPFTLADQVATSNYYLSTPTGSWDYQLRNYTDGSIGVVRGSDWANLMTFVGYGSTGLITPPWAGYTLNSTAVWEQIYANISYGRIESKEVAYPIGNAGIVIPANVEVEVYYQGDTYKLTSPANTAGSPYTVSVGADMLNGYYLAQDSADRIIDSWSSTNATEIFEDAGTDNSVLLLVSSVTIPQQVTYTNRNNITIDGQNIGKLFLADNVNLPMFECDNTNNICFKNLYFDGNSDGQIGTEDTMIEISTTHHFQFLNNYAINSWGDVVTGNNAVDVIIDSNYVENPEEDAFHAHGGSFWKITKNHIVGGEGVINFYCDIGQETTDSIASENTIIDCSSPSAAFRLDGPGTYRRITIDNNEVINPLNNGVSIDTAGLHEDITIESNTFVNGTHGIWVAKTGVGTYYNIDINNNDFKNQSLQAIMVEINCQNLQITKNTINNTGDVGARIHSNVLFSENTITYGKNYGLRIQNATSGTITNNIIQYNTYSAIFLYGTTAKPVAYFDISNNILNNNRQAATGVQGGILINDDGNAGAACHNNIISSNVICDNQGIPTQGYGVIESSNSFNNSISLNMFRGNTVSAISIIQTSNVTIRGNEGYNPKSIITNPFSGVLHWIVDAGNNATITSDWIYTNIQSPKMVYVSAGTVTAITVNGQATGLTSGSFRLEPFDTFQITFSEAPTLKVMGQ